MAYNIISANLNRFGNKGAFETDISTWGGINSYIQQFLLSRYATTPHEGLYSFRAEDNGTPTIGYLVYDSSGDFQMPFCVGGDNRAASSNGFAAGKKYVAKARVKVYAIPDNIVRTDVIKIRVYMAGGTDIAAANFEVTRTVGDVLDDGGWMEIETGWTSDYPLAIAVVSVFKSGANSGTSLSASTTSVTIPTAVDQIVNMTLDPALDIRAGSLLKIYNDATHYFHATVDSYDSGTGDIVLGTVSWTGSGNFSAWTAYEYLYPLPLGVDKFEIFEYEDIVVPCTLQIDVAGTDVTDETTGGANDGSIDVAITGGSGPFEYSKDGGSNWQSSPLFTGLPDGVYTIVVRETGNLSCNDTQTFAVNSGAAPAFDFTTTKTDETLAGAADGTIEVTVTGTGSPFTFSKNGGGTYQAGNIFSGLAPGTYTIVVKDNGGLIVAKNVTIAAGYAVFEKAWFSRNPITFEKGSISTWETEENYRLYDDVRVEDVAGSGSFASKLKVTLYPGEDGNVTFQVREAFRGVLTAVPPALNEDEIVRLTDRIKLFKHYTGSLFALETTPGTIVASNPHLVLLGGLSKFSWAGSDYFGTFLPTTNKFMTWAPVEKQVDRNQEDYLNFFVYALATTTLKLRIKAYFDDNTNTTSTVKTLAGVAYGQLYQIPAGPANAGVHLINPAKTVTKYELWLTDQADAVISEVRTYRLDAVSHPRKRLFMFLNSLGAYEVLRFTGAATMSTQVDKEQVVKFLPTDYAALDGEKEAFGSSMQEASSFSSGYLDDKYSAAWLDYLKDFLLSRRVFDVTDGKRRPIFVAPGTFQTGADQDFTRFIRFQALDSYEDDSYTPKDSGL